MKKRIVFISVTVLCIVLAAVTARFLLLPEAPKNPAVSDTDTDENTTLEPPPASEVADMKNAVDLRVPANDEYGTISIPEGVDFYTYRMMCALVCGDIDTFEECAGVKRGVYDGLRGLEIESYDIYIEDIPAADDSSQTREYPVLKIKIKSGTSETFSPGTYELVFEEGLYVTFWNKEHFEWFREYREKASPAVRYVYSVGSDRDFESIKKEGGRQFGLCDFIIDRLYSMDGVYAPRTEEEIKAYAEKYLGVDGETLCFEAVDKVDGGYQRVGRGGGSNVSSVISEDVTSDGITVVTMQFWADFSMTVPSRKVEFHMELVDGEYKPIKTVILEDSAFNTAYYST